MALFRLLFTRLVRIVPRQFLMFLVLPLLKLLAFLILPLLEFLLLLLVFLIGPHISCIRRIGAIHRWKVFGMICTTGGPAVLISRWSSFTRWGRRTIICSTV